MASDALNDLVDGMAPKEVKDKNAVPEEKFTILKFEQFQTAQLGTYEIAFQANNPGEEWNNAYDELNKATATIKARYHGQNYRYSFWLYGEGKIFRQKLKKQGEKPYHTST